MGKTSGRKSRKEQLLTETQKRELSDLYQRQARKFEKKYEKIIQKVLDEEFQRVADVLRKNGFVAAAHAASHMIFSPRITKVLLSLHKEVGLYFAKQTDKQIHDLLPKKKTGRVGFNPRWLRDIVAHFQNQALNLTQNINQTTRNSIEEVLTRAQNQGWGIEETASELEGDEISRQRARLIARTETAKAANSGRQAAVGSVGFQMNKEWIATLDLRTRFTHLAVNGTVIAEDDMFNVGGYDAVGPGDPDLPPEEGCNCRCTLAYIPARDANGKLIPK